MVGDRGGGGGWRGRDAPGWGRIFTTGLTIMGSPFSEFWGKTVLHIYG